MLADKPITGLVRKSLITIEDDKIQMHDLIQEMGRNIVLRSTENLGERSRLWIAQDVSFVLENNRGTEAIEGIYLPWNKEDEEVHLRPDVFEEMRKLRLLKFYDAGHLTLDFKRGYPMFRKVNKVYIDGDLKYLPNGLRYLHWECYPGKSLPSNFKPQYLVELDMPYRLKTLDISYCKNLQSLPELPLFIVSVNAEGCSSLEMVSTLRSTLTLGRWLDKYDRDNYCNRREFSFLNCTNLGEDAINNIFREFLYKVFCTATTPPEVVHSVSKKEIREVVLYYPTKEIPRWFNNQSEGSSITITLPPNWYNPKTFLGFVASVLFAKVHNGFDTLECKLHLKTNCGEKVVSIYAVFNGYSRVETVRNLDNMVVWYKYFGHSMANFEKYQEVSLEFTSRRSVLKRCGIRMLYLKDAVEESDEGTTANFESWRTDITDSDTSDDDFQSSGSDDGYQSRGS